jgi:iron(III) transport system ATP-binding protein
MATVHISDLRKSFSANPPTVAIDDLSVEIGEGEMLVLLGESGCGKTTTLRCLAGLEEPDSGTITVGDTVLFDGAKRVNLAPSARTLGMVFQTYALWPHMTVRRNLEYPLRARKMQQGLREGWVDDIAKIVDVERLLDRLPSQLSGGQQQRISLARALVARPEVILFDEPLSNLDAKLRESIRAEIHELHTRLGFTSLYVTHDQSEALALGDRLAVMSKGQIAQIGPPQEVFERPLTEHVASFVGMSNVVRLQRDGQGDLRSATSVGAVQIATAGGAEPKVLRVRPGDISLFGDHDAPADHLLFDGVVSDVAYLGTYWDVRVQTDDGVVMARVPNSQFARGARIEPQDRVRWGFPRSAAAVFDADGQAVDADRTVPA